VIEYPSISNASKAPRKPMLAFEKIDGSNIRIKWTPKNGFCLFGSRECLLDDTHPHLGYVVHLFNATLNAELDDLLRPLFRAEKEVVVYGEYYGPNSFAGIHVDPVEQMKLVVFDLLVVKKSYTEFVLPQDFVKLMAGTSIPTPRLVYTGTLGEDFINTVRENRLDTELNEGVVCKGRLRSGAYRGKVWMAKIKTNLYMDRLKERYGDTWGRFWE
jgi:ATP-dependent RNA circularization protein (DNA/RNA ligase family)